MRIPARPDPYLPIFRVEGCRRLFIRTGTAIGAVVFGDEVEVEIPEEMLRPGSDLYVHLDGETPLAAGVDFDFGDRPRIGGFHFAPGGIASARAGGDDVPAINPFSCWDLGFRPACPDPRGMALVTSPALPAPVWVDIYKLAVDHLACGTSRHGAVIADGDDLPQAIDGDGHTDRLDYATATAIYAHHGKQLLTYDEFRAAAFGVTEKSAAPRDPNVTGLDAPRTSRCGIMQVTGNLWDWGTDGDPDDPRPSIFGGSWFHGSDAGSRFALLGDWPGGSNGDLSARGRSDHLTLE